ncbi:MAG: universal stress protein [Solirubrobacterales bacterium]|nr:universal stress protein [Solirubrobacterales bacterium]
MAERRPKTHSLERVLGTGALFSTAYGNVGSSIYYALGLVAAFAAGMTPLVFVITGIIFFFTAATYIEGTTMFPEAGGSSSFARHAFNEFWSFFAAWAQMLNYIITAAISAYFVPHYLGVFWEPLKEAPWDIVFGIGVLVVLGMLNIFGAEESANVNIVLSLVDFATQVLLVILGLFLVFNADLLIGQVDFGTAPTVENFLIAIPVGMVAYTGIETISNLAEEAKDYEKTVPAAAKLVVAAVFAIYLFLPAIALSAMPVNAAGATELGTTYAGDPVLGIVKNMGLGSFENAVEIYVGILAATILFIATNAGIIGVSRLTYSMGQYRQVPQALRSLHPKFKTPYIAIIVFGTIACLVIVPGQAEFLAKLYAFGALLSFTIAHVSVIKMRLDLPIRQRPWLGPLNVQFRDRSWPLFAFIGGAGTFIAWVVVTALNPSTLVFGVFWMVAGVLFYVFYRRSQGLGLTVTNKIVAPKTIVDHDVEYDSVLVVFEDGIYSQEAVRTAVKMATRRRRGIHVLVTINVPANAPIAAVLPTAESKAASVIERARVLGGRRVTGHWVKVRSGEAGSRIVHEANEINARAIVFPLKPDLSGSLFSPAVQKVLAARPCRVILTSDSAEKSAPVR